MKSKYAIHEERIIKLAHDNDFKPFTVQRLIAKELGLHKRGGNALARYVGHVVNGLSQANKELNENGISTEQFRHGWIKTQKGSYFIKNEHIVSYDEIRDQLLRDVSDYAPKYPKLKYNKLKEPSALIIDIADLHINKMMSEYETGEKSKDIDTFKKEIKAKVSKLVNQSKPYNVDFIIFVGGNDVCMLITLKIPQRQELGKM